MVEMVIDPIRPPSITLSGEEIQEIRDGIAAGLYPPDFLKRCDEARARNVFGHDAKQDRHGNYIEQGLGAKGHETANHFTALKKSEAMGIELPGTYDREVAAMWKRDPDRAKRINLPAPPLSR
jgi:hypothetical protein